MSRREIVLLVSRAIAILQLIPALMELIIGVPQQIYLMLLPILRAQAAFPGVGSSTDFLSILRFSAFGFSLARIAVQLFAAWLFWNCGPTIERFLLPTGSAPEQTVEPIQSSLPS
jgi:hypothetical protein